MSLHDDFTNPIHTENQTKKNTNERFEDDLGNDLRITKTRRRASGGGTWVYGTIAGHRFDALVFPEHAENEDYELATAAFRSSGSR
ncbi:MAG TPA: hypothetical protein PKD64_19290 [Pirellulaceae bacterium]|nr:hypothetical protein [Pirellulaceae bacterium]